MLSRLEDGSRGSTGDSAPLADLRQNVLTSKDIDMGSVLAASAVTSLFGVSLL
jgi:hypothetical protein